MADFALTSHELAIDGRNMTVTVQQDPNDTTQLKISWTLPANPKAYDGLIILVSDTPFNDQNQPEDGKKYLASSNLSAPADLISGAQVAAAIYGYFGGNTATTTLTVSNADPTKLYYASLHVASNILQYHTVGIQSYPTDPARFEPLTPFAGGIPDTPPVNPTNGQVYFDRPSNSVLVWDSVQSAWVATADKTVNTGQRPPVEPNQIFYNTATEKLRFLVGGMWVDCNSSNARVKFGVSWVALGTVGSYAALSASPTDGDVAFITGPLLIGTNTPDVALKVFTLGQWLNFSPALFQFQTSPSVWTPVVVGDALTSATDPLIPNVGDFFYKTTTRDLLAWNGTDWVKSDTDPKVPTPERIGVGDTGSYDERVRLERILKGQLGYPATCVELEEENFNIAIDNALQTFRQRADNAYAPRFVILTLQQGQQIYYLNDPRNGSDKIVNIMKIHRVNTLGAAQLNDPVYGQLFLPQLYSAGSIDLVSVHLMHQLSESFERIFAGNLMYTWDETTRVLSLDRHIQRAERVVLETVIERTEQELLQDRWCQQWLQGWALAELKSMLGMARSKYSSVAGPNGGLTLNGDLLLSEARLDFDDLMRQINDYEVGNGGTFTGNASFWIM